VERAHDLAFRKARDPQACGSVIREGDAKRAGARGDRHDENVRPQVVDRIDRDD
jgi:hypothetical protein